MRRIVISGVLISAWLVAVPVSAWVTLDKLARGKPFKGPVRVTFEGDALRLKADRTELIPFEALRHLASALPD